MRLGYIFIFSIIFLLSFSSCRKTVKNGVRWETEILAPLAKGSITIESLVGDTLIEKNSDNSLSLVYRNNIYSLNLAQESLEIPDTSLKQVVTLDSIVLTDRSVTYPFTLGRLAKEDDSGIGGTIILLNGQTAAIPAINGLSATDQEVDASSLFESATLQAGFMDLEIENGFPVDIEDVVFRLKNSSNGSIIVMDSFDIIPKGSIVSKTFDLSGKTIEGNLLVDIVNLNSPGSNGQPVKIDTSDALILRVTARDLDIQAATAIFPSQNLIEIKNEVEYNMNGPEFTFLKIKSGKLVISAVNTIEDTLKLNYKIPGAKSATGVPIDIYTSVLPAPPGGSISVDEVIDLAGYTIDLTGINKNKVNTFYNEFTARIDSTGKLISISLDDSVSVFYGLQNIVPEYVKGYVGEYNYNVGPSTVPFDVFAHVQSGQLDLDQVNVGLSIYNGMGVDSRVYIDHIKSLNNRTGNSIDLNSNIIGQNISIPRAYENPYQPGYKEFQLDKNNSNIKDLIENFPDKLQYKLKLDVNPDGNKFNYQDFVYFDDNIDVNLNLEIPLNFQANALVLQDTFDFKIPSDPDKDPAVKDGTISLIVDNGFPLTANIQLYFASQKGLIIDSLFISPEDIIAADLNSTTCLVNEKAYTKIKAEIDEAKVDRLTTAEKVIIRVRFDSKSPSTCGDKVKIYSDYGIDFKLLANFNYKIQDL